MDSQALESSVYGTDFSFNLVLQKIPHKVLLERPSVYSETKTGLQRALTQVGLVRALELIVHNFP